MATATVSQTGGELVSYTPGSAVAAGDVILIGNVVGVAPRDIAASTLGVLLIANAVVKFPKTAGSGAAIAVGVQLYWDAGNEVATATASTHKKLGVSILAATDADTEVRVRLGHHVA